MSNEPEKNYGIRKIGSDKYKLLLLIILVCIIV